MTVSRVERGGLRIAQELDDLVKNAIAPGTGIDVEAFWSGFETCLDELGPLNRELLSVRDEFQRQIDQWHLDRKGSALDAQEYKTFLSDIGYLLPEPMILKSPLLMWMRKFPLSPASTGGTCYEC